MDYNTYFKNLSVPEGTVDMVLDTDTFNEVDDQFALAYTLANSDRLNLKAIYAAPFFNGKSTSPEDGMLKSYDEIINVLKLAGREDLISETYKGSTDYLKDEQTYQPSDAVTDLANRAMNYSPENPLYVVAIGAITNIASALLLKPEIKENIVIIWLGGHDISHPHTREFNMFQDIAAARVVFASDAPLVQLPCAGVVSGFIFPYCELEHFLKGKNKLCDFLLARVHEAVSSRLEKGETASRVIWDVTAVAWLLNTDERFMLDKIIHAPIPEYDNLYAPNPYGHLIKYVHQIKRDSLANDLFKKLAEKF